MPPTSPFDLGQEIGLINGKLDELMNRTENLPALSAKVERHDSELRTIKTFGYLLGMGIVGSVANWFRAHFGSRP